MSFAELGLNPALLTALSNQGYENPTAVQAQAIPAALQGADLLVSSQTGSGKTAAFLLPCLQRLGQAALTPGFGPRVLVLCPTRELAQQVHKAADTYGRATRGLRTASVVGGTPYHVQMRLIRQPLDIMVATPGRLLDLVDSGRLNLGRVETLVLDEADRMLDMGFIEDIETIAARTPESRQTLLFSATLEGVVGKLAQRVTRNAQRIEIATVAQSQPKIDQRIHFVDNLGHKTKLLDHLLRDTELNQAVVFTATKRTADEITDSLLDQGFAAAALHGDMNQRERNRTLTALRRGATRVLVATDVAARGIDVPGISHVINFDLPKQVEDYVHRIGRTGRAGRTGTAVSLVEHRERHRVRDIERYTDQTIAVSVVPGLEPTARPPRPAGAKPRSFGTGRPAGASQGRSFGNREGSERRFGEGAGRGRPEGRSFSNGPARKPAARSGGEWRRNDS